MKNTACRPKIIVSADGSGMVSQAGALLLTWSGTWMSAAS